MWEEIWFMSQVNKLSDYMVPSEHPAKLQFSQENILITEMINTLGGCVISAIMNLPFGHGLQMFSPNHPCTAWSYWGDQINPANAAGIDPAGNATVVTCNVNMQTSSHMCRW